MQSEFEYTPRYLVGDIFDLMPKDQKILLPHVCNNQNAWGAGFVVPLGRRYPLVKELYHAGFNNGLALGDVQYVNPNDNLTVANMIAQTLGGRRPLYYNHLVHCMENVANRFHDEANNAMEFDGIYAPLFGSKLAGGNWFFIEELIIDCWTMRRIPVTICVLPEETGNFSQLNFSKDPLNNV